MFDFKPVASSLYDHLVFDLWYHFILWLIMFCRYAWLWLLLLSLLVTPSLLLAFTCTEYELYSCIQLPKTKLFPMCPPYLPISILLFQLYSSCFYLSSKLNFLLWENYLVKLSWTWWHIYFLTFNKLDHCCSLMLRVSSAMLSWGTLTTLHLFLFSWYHDLWFMDA
jgi:hypothetical protein